MTTGDLREPTGVARAIASAAPASPLAELVRDPFRFDFFQAVRLIKLAAVEGPPTSKRVPASIADQPYEEHVRFRAHVGLGFPANTVFSCGVPPAADTDSNGVGVPEMTVTFLALAGTSGVLPWHYTQLLIDRIREKDFGLRDFLDVFNHRLIAHFYRAWEKSHFYVGYEASRRAGAKQPDRFTQMLFGLVGMGTGGLRHRQAITDEVLLYYAGHFSNRTRSAAALGQIVADMFALPTEIKQFQGQWMRLRLADQTQLQVGRNNQLGVSAVAGARVWGIEGNIRVRLRVERHEYFQQFMPGGPAYTSVGQTVRSFLGPSFGFDLQIVLSKEEVPRCQLTRAGSVRLGWNTWLFSGAPTRDVDDAVFSCEGMPYH